jgi:hypothetical protein
MAILRFCHTTLRYAVRRVSASEDAMAIFLKENEVGFDAQKIGFPGLGSCMAIVLQTPHGLFGRRRNPGQGPHR